MFFLVVVLTSFGHTISSCFQQLFFREPTINILLNNHANHIFIVKYEIIRIAPYSMF